MRLSIALCCLICCSSGWSQESTPSVRVTVESNVPQVRVFVDSVFVGTTPLVDLTLSPGRHMVCVVASESRRWFPDAICETIEVEEGLQVSLHVPRSFMITSEPFGASVISRDTLRGETPYLASTSAETGSFRLRKHGYDDVVLTFDASTKVLHGVLKPNEIDVKENLWLYLENEETHSIAPLVVSISSAVLSGGMAAYWKLRADDLYRSYQQTGNPGTLNRIHRLDMASGIALGVSQVSLALLTYFLVSR